jgi:hypothetical protein
MAEEASLCLQFSSRYDHGDHAVENDNASLTGEATAQDSTFTESRQLWEGVWGTALGAQSQRAKALHLLDLPCDVLRLIVKKASCI